MTTLDTVLDRVVALWAQAKEHEDQSKNFAAEAENQQYFANDRFKEADALLDLLDNVPQEWKDAIDECVDPRDIDIEVNVTVNDQNFIALGDSNLSSVGEMP
jgi:hypothetical protein